MLNEKRFTGLEHLLGGKTEFALSLFEHLVQAFDQVANKKSIVIATKSMIVIGQKPNQAYVIQVGKNFVDVVFPFKRAWVDNLCFRKIAQVPNSHQFNHHLRILTPDDINSEVRNFIKKLISGTHDSSTKGEA